MALRNVTGHAPDWISTEMPPGYRTRLLEIERLSDELHAMDAVGRVLWETGEPLQDAVATLFGDLKCEVEAFQGAAGPIAVALGPSQRLLVVAADSPGPVHKTHPDITRAFQAVQAAGPNDRVVFLPPNDPDTPPAARPDPVLPDARALLERMGVQTVTTSDLFRLWRLGLEDRHKAHKALERLHAEEGKVAAAPWA